MSVKVHQGRLLLNNSAGAGTRQGALQWARDWLSSQGSKRDWRFGAPEQRTENHCEIMWVAEVKPVELTRFLLKTGSGSPDTFVLRTKRPRDSSEMSTMLSVEAHTHTHTTIVLAFAMQM